MFTVHDVEKRLREIPFIPLRIVTSSGQSFDVHHPDLVLLGRRYLVVGVPSSENPKHFDQSSNVSIMHITALENLPSGKPSTSNGEG